MIRITDPVLIGRALGEVRRLLQISQYKIAAVTGMTQGMISSHENGRETPSLLSVIKYAGALGYDLCLIEREDEE
jgi:transcriptional regulator with XRE-family HTH domain